MTAALGTLASEIRACRICVEQPLRKPLPHAPRPVLQVSATARIAICGQAPGTKVHHSGQPFTDRSGDRLRDWTGLSSEEFYDCNRIAIVPMGFCFPGQDAKGGDLPPRPECAKAWHARVFRQLESVELILLVGQYAQAYHLGDRRKSTLTETVQNFRTFLGANSGPRMFPLPHPSWRNTGWLKKHPWFEFELLPQLKLAVRSALD